MFANLILFLLILVVGYMCYKMYKDKEGKLNTDNGTGNGYVYLGNGQVMQWGYIKFVIDGTLQIAGISEPLRIVLRGQPTYLTWSASMLKGGTTTMVDVKDSAWIFDTVNTSHVVSVGCTPIIPNVTSSGTIQFNYLVIGTAV